jgi:hypothetical protein
VYVAMTSALADPLGRIGAPAAGVAQLFTVHALDPADGMPKVGRAVWKTPQGPGAHSLPPDFEVVHLPRVDGRRVFVVFGPRLAAVKLVRVLPTDSLYGGVRAELREPKKLEGTLEARLFEEARAYQPSPEELAFLAQSPPVAVGAPLASPPPRRTGLSTYQQVVLWTLLVGGAGFVAFCAFIWWLTSR